MADGTGTVGVGGPEFPVAVPLLDASHLELAGPPETRAVAEAMVESLLMRVVGHFRPGWCSCTCGTSAG